ncbi:MAG TPA: DUF4190 domain-containing protein, partial [Pirellula sp.]|nr:DUF4190 domain-containing protein [Pirellula sp.]
LRVNDEFVGRKARCPICGFVYVVGGDTVGEPTQGQIVSDAAMAETTHATENSVLPMLQPVADSREAFATDKSASKESSNQVTQALAESIAEIETPLTSDIPHVCFDPVAKFFVRTPNSMVYGPTDTETILDWINQGRLDDTCHIREQTSEQWLGMAAWRFQSRKLQNPMTSPVNQASNQFGAAPLSTVQSVGTIKTGNGMVVLVLGIVSWVLCPIGLGWICSLLAIIFALVELGKIRHGQSPRNEKTIVLIGMWLGIANLLVTAFSIIALIGISIFNA